MIASFPRSCCFSAKKEKFQDASFCIYDPQMFSAYNKFLINPGVPSGFPQLTNTWPSRPFLQIGQWRQIAQRISGEVKKGKVFMELNGKILVGKGRFEKKAPRKLISKL